MYGSRRQVYNGSCTKTTGGLEAGQLLKVKKGHRMKGGRKVSTYKIVSAKRHAQGKKNLWAKSLKLARKKLRVEGFVPLSKEAGTEGYRLYKTAKKFHKELKAGRRIRSQDL